METTLTEDYNKIIAFINANQVFFMRDLYDHMGIETTEGNNIHDQRVQNAIKCLIRKKLLAVIKTPEKNNRQCIVINPDLKLHAGILSERGKYRLKKKL